MGKLIIKKAHKWYNGMRNFPIHLNNFKVGEVTNKKTLELNLRPGKYVLTTKISYFKKRSKTIEIKDNDILEFDIFTNFNI